MHPATRTARASRNAQPVARANDFQWPFQRAVGGQQAVARLEAAMAASRKSRPWSAGPSAGARPDYGDGRCQRSDMHDRPASILPISDAPIGTTR